MNTVGISGSSDDHHDIGQDGYLLLNLRLVQAGVKSHLPGIHRCQDCRAPYIDDHSGLKHCPTCRIDHRRFCHGCHRLVTNTVDGDRLCVSCVGQEPLF